jgi:hypothetical protein
MSNIIPFSLPLTPILPRVEGNLDYNQERRELERINQLLETSGAETQFIEACLAHHQPPTTPLADLMNPKQQIRFQEQSRRALRCNLARVYVQADYRGMAARLADSPLYQWFCSFGQMDVIKVPSKSTLHAMMNGCRRRLCVRLWINCFGPAEMKRPNCNWLNRWTWRCSS